jgi:hypothetical protein
MKRMKAIEAATSVLGLLLQRRQEENRRGNEPQNR